MLQSWQMDKERSIPLRYKNSKLKLCYLGKWEPGTFLLHINKMIKNLFPVAIALCAIVFNTSSFGIAQEKRKYCSSPRNVSTAMKTIMKRSQHNVHTVPTFESGKPLEIKIALSVLAFRDMKEVDMTYTVDFFLRTKWIDKRLRNPLNCILTMTMGKKHPAEIIWVPDTMIENSVTSNLHEVLTNNHKIDISPGGEVFWSTRVTVKAMCKMDLLKFPRDKQTCSIVLLSYAYTNELVHYVWDESDPLGVMGSTLSQFDVTSHRRKNYSYVYVAGEYSILEASFVFERRIGYYLIQVYIPCIFLVVLAGLSFWVDSRATPARVALGLTTLLTIATVWSAANSNMPPVSYIKAIDIYFLTSFCFVLATLLEYIVILNYHTLKQEIKKHFSGRMPLQNHERNSCSFNVENHIKRPNVNEEKDENIPLNDHFNNGTTQNETKYDMKTRSQNNEADVQIVLNMDKITRFLYPAAYIVFNIVYWYQLR